ncbi:E3 ubiquitin-protein ligase TRIM39-like [Mauremys reevesii]|uniref:E3 ubiquitin-protein ligase TRIM39-like n=1 Tax=Mauremys reevesii TaxID=260615 RepID=UPI00193ED2FF|nr:E3 ubiquitin-protein ligase TRIM39-like [Mauremys reevesii]XP_039360183.1 E3 ubiquitin-protein ligase TRIM39-like [Mauremys reevesii]
MASAVPIGKALEEATCSICLECLTEPVTIDCGHNFCRACITQYSERRKRQSGTKFPCPECRALFQKGNFRPNRQLANIIESIKPLRLQPGQAQNENLCETHKEKLQLLCQEDGKATCVVPIEEVAQGYKVKLQETLGPLRQELEEALALVSEEEKKIREWQGKVENRRRSITREFRTLHQLLSEEEQLLLRRLAEEERETLQRLQDNITKLSEQSAAPINRITELEEKCQQPAAELLQGVKSTLIRSEHVKLQPPEAVSPALKSGYKICLDMREMLKRFTLDVTLDPDTAHPNLVLSQDRKRVRHKTKRQNLPNNPERFDPCVFVLGAEGFTGGRHYWEVEVGDKTRWILGVCKESVSRKSPDHLSPKNGYWTVCLRDGEYEALTFPAAPLHVGIRPCQVGIFLDYKAGEVSFYNVTDRSHLFTFTDTFSGTVRPFFSPCANAGGKNAAPLILCSVPAQARGNLGP